MIRSAFECFDCFTFIEVKHLVWFNWRILIILLLCFRLWSNFNIVVNFFILILDFTSSVLIDQNIRKVRGSLSFCLSLFFIIFFCNFSGLVSFFFSCSRHIIWSFFLGFPIWLSLQLERFIQNPFVILSRFLPRGASFILSLVEILSLIIQPLTLSIRLMANLRAGHVVISLVGRLCCFLLIRFSFINFFNFLILSFIIYGYLIFEFAVNLVQSYIFFLLIARYGRINISIHNYNYLI